MSRIIQIVIVTLEDNGQTNTTTIIPTGQAPGQAPPQPPLPDQKSAYNPWCEACRDKIPHDFH